MGATLTCQRCSESFEQRYGGPPPRFCYVCKPSRLHATPQCKRCGGEVSKGRRSCEACTTALAKERDRRKKARRRGGPPKFNRRPDGSPRKDRTEEYAQARLKRAEASAEARAAREAMAEARRSERAAIKAAKAEARQHARVERLRLKPWRAPGLTSGERFAIRYRLDPDYCIRQRLRAAFRRKRQGIKLGDLLRCAIKRAGRSPRAEAFLGYTVPDLRRHLDRQFRDGMDWARFCAGEIHIDHILPLAGFDLADPDELRAAWALPNLRPAWAVDNRTKAARRTHLL